MQTETLKNWQKLSWFRSKSQNAMRDVKGIKKERKWYEIRKVNQPDFIGCEEDVNQNSAFAAKYFGQPAEMDYQRKRKIRNGRSL